MYQKVYINIVDHFSKFDYSFVQNSKSSKKVQDNFKIYLEKCGIPKNVQTDKGGEFVNKEFQKFCENKGITLIHGAPRHPQSQGAVEAFNNTFKKLFSVLIHDPNYKFNLNQIVLNIFIFTIIVFIQQLKYPLYQLLKLKIIILKSKLLKILLKAKKKLLEGLKKIQNVC